MMYVFRAVAQFVEINILRFMLMNYYIINTRRYEAGPAGVCMSVLRRDNTIV